jgi:CBS domain-containing protein
MERNDPLMNAPASGEAIDRQPLRVTPDTLLVEAIALMSETRGQSCLLPNSNSAAEEISINESRSSCVLVMQDSQLLGIFTERDIVRLVASNTSFAGVKIGEVMNKPVITLNEAHFQDIFAALFLFRRYRIRHLPIVDDRNRLLGVVSPESIRQILRPTNLLKLRRVSEVMTTKVIRASMDYSAIDLAKLMATFRVSCIVITQEDDDKDIIRPVGIVTERDIMQFQSLNLTISKIKAKDVMSTPLFLLSPEDSLWAAHQEMQRRRVRRLVVSWNWGQDLGIVTQTSLLRVFDPMEMYGVIETLQRTVEQLETEKTQQLSKNSSELIQPESELSSLVELNELDRLRSEQIIDRNCSRDRIEIDRELEILLSRLQISVKNITNKPTLSAELEQRQLDTALSDLEHLHKHLNNLRTHIYSNKSTSNCLSENTSS